MELVFTESKDKGQTSIEEISNVEDRTVTRNRKSWKKSMYS